MYKRQEGTPPKVVAVWVTLTSRHQARASKPSSQQCGEVFRRAFFSFFFMTEESKENPPPGGYGNDERDDTDRQRAEEAPVSRLEMEAWEREGRVEMEKWERHRTSSKMFAINSR